MWKQALLASLCFGDCPIWTYNSFVHRWRRWFFPFLLFWCNSKAPSLPNSAINLDSTFIWIYSHFLLIGGLHQMVTKPLRSPSTNPQLPNQVLEATTMICKGRVTGRGMIRLEDLRGYRDAMEARYGAMEQQHKSSHNLPILWQERLHGSIVEKMNQMEVTQSFLLAPSTG